MTDDEPNGVLRSCAALRWVTKKKGTESGALFLYPSVTRTPREFGGGKCRRLRLMYSKRGREHDRR